MSLRRLCNGRWSASSSTSQFQGGRPPGASLFSRRNEKARRCVRIEPLITIAIDRGTEADELGERRCQWARETRTVLQTAHTKQTLDFYRAPGKSKNGI